MKFHIVEMLYLILSGKWKHTVRFLHAIFIVKLVIASKSSTLYSNMT